MNLRVDEIKYFTKNTTSSKNVLITQEINEGRLKEKTRKKFYFFVQKMVKERSMLGHAHRLMIDRCNFFKKRNEQRNDLIDFFFFFIS